MDLYNFVGEVLTPLIYSNANQIFTGLELKESFNYWYTNKHLDGTQGSNKKEVVLTRSGSFVGFGSHDDTKHYINYIQEQRGVNYPDAVKYLCSLVGIEYPDEVKKEACNYQRKKDIYKDITDFCAYLLDQKNNKVREYLLNTRKTPEKAIKEGILGAFDSDKVIKHLINKNYSENEIKEALTSSQSGFKNLESVKEFIKDNNLFIPYFDNWGNVTGFKLRDTDGTHTDKEGNIKRYYYTINEPKNLYKLPIKTNCTPVIVEGEIDVLTAQAYGFNNVCGISGINKLTKEKAIQVKQRGFNYVCICPDFDGKETKHVNEVLRAVKIFNSVGVLCDIVSLPNVDGKKLDIDKLLTTYEDGKEELLKCFAAPENVSNYIISSIIKEGLTDNLAKNNLIYNAIFGAVNYLNENEFNNVEKRLINELQASQIEIQSIYNAIKEDKAKREANEQKTNLIKSIESLKNQYINIDTPDLKTFENQLKGILRPLNNEQEGNKFANAVCTGDAQSEFKNVIKEIEGEGEPIKTGFKIGGNNLFIYPSALTFFAAATSHGKTTTLINLCYNLAKENQSNNEKLGAYYFISLEERASKLNTKFSLLNYFVNTPDKSKLIKDNATSLIYEAVKRPERANEHINKDTLKQFFKDMPNIKVIDTTTTGENIRDINNLCELIKYLYTEGKAKAIIIDYIQLLKDNSLSNNSIRQLELQSICNKLSDVCKQTALPIVLGAQFNRESSKDPFNAEIEGMREAGDIEQVANKIIMLVNCSRVNDEVFNKFMEDKNPELIPQKNNLLFMRVGKDRDGGKLEGDFIGFNGNYKALYELDTNEININNTPIFGAYKF